jgi:hypothetical protein
MGYQHPVDVDLFYKGYKIKGRRLDLLFEDAVVVEFKSDENLPDVILNSAAVFRNEKDNHYDVYT